MDIGFIGLGNMGFPMVRRLLEAGHRVVVFDTRKEPVEQAGRVGRRSRRSRCARSPTGPRP